ncbi:MAG: hypothetical protein KDC95_06235 [Planctomycetes bacterium]|nr:hypothetical protein [Planctomycetota bacterium]
MLRTAFASSFLFVCFPGLCHGALAAQGQQEQLEAKSGVVHRAGSMKAVDWTKPFVPAASQPKPIQHGNPWPVLPTVAETAPLRTPATPAPALDPRNPKPLGLLPHIQANRDVTFTGQFRSTVSEPTTSQWGNTLFYTHNWDAATSTNGGLSWSRRDPRRLPSIDGGFCCDQYTIHVPTLGNEMTLWLLQYSYSQTTQRNTQRICVYRSEDSLRSGALVWWDFDPSLFGFSAKHWLDFPHMSYGDRFAYATSNVFLRNANGTDSYAGSVCFRMLLSDLKTQNVSLPFSYVVQGTTASTWRLAQGIKATAYWWEILNSATGRLYWWPENSSTVTRRQIAMFSFNFASGSVSLDKSGRNFMGRADSRPLAGWVARGVIGFAWMAGPSTNRPHPFTRFIELSEANKTRIQEIDIWNPAGCWAYPAVGVNQRGDVGGVMTYGQSDRYPGSTCWIMDATDPSPVQNALYFANGAGGPSQNDWGDYMTVEPHPKYPNSWIGTGMALNSTNGFGSNQIPRFVWFGRTADLQVKPDLVPTSLTASTTNLQPLAFLQLYANVTNEGPGASTSAASIGWYLSTDSVISTNDTLLGQTTMQAHSAYASHLYTTTVRVPATAQPGTCYLGVYADHTNANAEEFESNNTRALAVMCKAPLADLMVSTFLVTPTTFQRGQQVGVETIVFNAGNIASTACTSAYYLSQDSLITTSDQLLATFTTPAIGAQSIAPTDKRSIQIPTSAPLGTCYVGAYADTLNTVVESSDTNNYASRIATCQDGTPDLAILSVTADATAVGGALFGMPITTENRGTGVAPASVTGVLLSNDLTISTMDTLLGKQQIPSLDPGRTSTQTSRFVLPRSFGQSTGYVGAWADVDGSVTELSETNNTLASSAVAITPFAGSGRDLEWIPRIGTAATTASGPATFQLGAGPRNAAMCVVAPSHVGEYHVLFWSGSKTVAIDPLSEFSFRFANTNVLPGFLGFVKASGRSYPEQNLPQILGLPKIQVFTFSAWFDASFTTFLGFGTSSTEAFVGS